MKNIKLFNIHKKSSLRWETLIFFLVIAYFFLYTCHQNNPSNNFLYTFLVWFRIHDKKDEIEDLQNHKDYLLWKKSYSFGFRRYSWEKNVITISIMLTKLALTSVTSFGRSGEIVKVRQKFGFTFERYNKVVNVFWPLFITQMANYGSFFLRFKIEQRVARVGIDATSKTISFILVFITVVQIIAF